MRAPEQSRSEASAARMVAAALDLLAEGGLPAVTVAAVAQRSSTSNGALYHRFGDRTGLLLAVQDRVMTRVEDETAAAFAAAGREPDDDRAVHLLARAALALFAAHRGAMRAFLVEAPHAPGGDVFTARTVRSSHLLSRTVAGWLVARLGAAPRDAEATWQVLFALAAAQALFDDDQISAGRLHTGDLADAIARAISAIVRRRP